MNDTGGRRRCFFWTADILGGTLVPRPQKLPQVHRRSAKAGRKLQSRDKIWGLRRVGFRTHRERLRDLTKRTNIVVTNPSIYF